MALLKKINSDQKIPLLSFHIIGRLKDKVDLHINAFDVSRIHASIEYKDNEWVFYDQSSNGTLYNDQLVHRSTRSLELGDIMQFSAEEPQQFEVVNLGIPESFLISEDGTEVIFANKKFIDLDYNHAIYCLSDDRWIIERNDTITNLEDEGIIENYKGKNWHFRINEVSGLTEITRSRQEDVKICLEVSPDYEHVSVKLEVDKESIQLPTKAMNYPLYLLAKQMQEDLQTDQYSDSEKGWINNDTFVDTLKKELCNNELDIYYLNVQIYRLRKSFRKTAYGELLNGLIERRSGQMRLNHQNFTIKEYQSLD
ncbi:MAG: FHA domain-containing protein [Bacteroidota bacterium]